MANYTRSQLAPAVNIGNAFNYGGTGAFRGKSIPINWFNPQAFLAGDTIELDVLKLGAIIEADLSNVIIENSGAAYQGVISVGLKSDGIPGGNGFSLADFGPKDNAIGARNKLFWDPYQNSVVTVDPAVTYAASLPSFFGALSFNVSAGTPTNPVRQRLAFDELTAGAIPIEKMRCTPIIFLTLAAATPANVKILVRPMYSLLA